MVRTALELSALATSIRLGVGTRSTRGLSEVLLGLSVLVTSEEMQSLAYNCQ